MVQIRSSSPPNFRRPVEQQPAIKNPAVDIGDGIQRSTHKKSVDTWSGTLEATMITQAAPMVSSHTSSREHGVTGLQFKPNGKEFFGNPPPATLVVELKPVVGGQVQEGRTTKVTLQRAADGTYKAAAPEKKSFTPLRSSSISCFNSSNFSSIVRVVFTTVISHSLFRIFRMT